MNIFVLDLSPKKAAQYHNDKHVVKMILESAQMLMSSYHLHPSNPYAVKDSNCYKLTHQNHPCTKWVNTSIENWCWLFDLVTFLNEEYKERFNHDEDHLSYRKLCYMINTYDFPAVGPGPLTPFALAMPDEYKSEDAVNSYKIYYICDKQHIAEWKNGAPDWYRFIK